MTTSFKRRLQIRGLVIVAAMAVAVMLFLSNEPTGTPPQFTPQPNVIVETLDSSLDQFAPMWRDEIGRRFSNAVAILVHGGDFVKGEWIVGTDIQPGHVMKTVDVVKHFQKLHPGRTVILLSCNPGHLKLGIPGVYYAKANVWCVPDRAITAEMYQNTVSRMKFSDASLYQFIDESLNRKTRWEEMPEVTGSIFEFVCD